MDFLLSVVGDRSHILALSVYDDLIHPAHMMSYIIIRRMENVCKTMVSHSPWPEHLPLIPATYPPQHICHGQVTVSTFSSSQEMQDLRSLIELQSHSLQQVELEVISGNIASRGASGILRRLRITVTET
jgi:hypothetical protein